MNKKIIFLPLFGLVLLFGIIQIHQHTQINAAEEAPATGWLDYGKERIGRLAGYLQSIRKGTAAMLPKSTPSITGAIQTIRRVAGRATPLFEGAKKAFFGKNKLYIVLGLVKDITPSIVQIYKTTDALRKTLLSDSGKIQQITKIYNNFYINQEPTYYAGLRANNFLLRETVAAVQKEKIVHNLVSIIHDTTTILQVIVQKGQELLVDNDKLANKLQKNFKTLYNYSNNFSTLLLGASELKALRKNNAQEKSLITLLPRDIYSLSSTILSNLFGSSKEPMPATPKKELPVKASSETQIVKTTEESLYNFFMKVNNIISTINTTLLTISLSKSPMQKELNNTCSSLNSPTIHHGIMQSIQHTSRLLDLFIDQIIPIRLVVEQIGELINSLEQLLLQLNQSWLVKSTISGVINGVIQNLHNTQTTILELANSLVKQEDKPVREITRKASVGLTRELYSSPEEQKALPPITKFITKQKLIEASKPKVRTSFAALDFKKQDEAELPKRPKKAQEALSAKEIARIRKEKSIPENTTINLAGDEEDEDDDDGDVFFDPTEKGKEVEIKLEKALREDEQLINLKESKQRVKKQIEIDTEYLKKIPEILRASRLHKIQGYKKQIERIERKIEERKKELQQQIQK